MSLDQIVKELEARPAESGGHIYHPIPFPEFAHLETSSNSKAVYAKWALIEKSLTRIFPEGLADKEILDVGANAGFYTYTLANLGANVTAFEPHPRYSQIGPVIIKEKQLDVEWHGSVVDPDRIREREFDVTLMLSVFQWMAAGGEKLDGAVATLRTVAKQSRYLVFELGFNAGKSCLNTEKRNHYAELVRLLEQATDYQYFQLLGTTRLWQSNRRYLVLCSHDQRFNDGVTRRLFRALTI